MKQHYNKGPKDLARNLRNESTKSEIYLWQQVLRARQMKGYTFNRQRPTGNFIADFVCKPLLLIIEIDGYSHIFNEVKEKDEIKELFLKESGCKVLRFTDGEVFNDLQNMIRIIESTIEDIEKKSEHPPPP